MKSKSEKECGLVGVWISTEDEVPSNDEVVLALVNGKCGNITFKNAYLLASYFKDGWLLEDYPDTEEFTVSYWLHLPEAPKECFEACGESKEKTSD